MTTDYSVIVPDRLVLDGDDGGYEAARLVIDDEGRVSVDVHADHGAGGHTIAEWNRCTLVYELANAKHGPIALDVDRLRADLSAGGKLAVLIARIIAGHSVAWDGSNHVGRLTDDAQEAHDDLCYRLDANPDGDGYVSETEVWRALDWLTGSGTRKPANVLREVGLEPGSSLEQAQVAAAGLHDEATRDGVIIVGSLEGALCELAVQAQEQGEEDAP
jgi:hypothetical protein